MDATLAQLIAKPQAYQGKTVRVAGYLHLEFEGNGLYPSKADSEHYRTAKGVWLDPAGPLYQAALAHNNSHVIVVGTFDAEDRGHLGLWPGAINHLERLDQWMKKN